MSMAHAAPMPWPRFATDVAVTVLLCICTLWAEFLATPRAQGYFCDDQSISFPVPAGETVPSYVVYTVGPLIGLLVIAGTEIHNSALSARRRAGIVLNAFGRTVSIHPCLLNIYHYAGYLLVGAATGLLSVDVIKVTVGRLRPYFLARCRPSAAALALCAGDPRAYVSEPNCTNANAYEVQRARLSFPSGHAAFCFYSAIFLGFYLHFRGRWTDVSSSPMVKYAVRMVLFIAAIWVSLTRVTDRAHHALDVVVGGLVGAALGLATTYAGFPVHMSSACARCGAGGGGGPAGDSETEGGGERARLLDNYEACVVDSERSTGGGGGNAAGSGGSA